MSAARTLPAPLAVRLLASTALIVASGGYVLWQPKIASRPVINFPVRNAAVSARPMPAAIAPVAEMPAAPVAAKIAAMDRPRAQAPVHPAERAPNLPASGTPYQPLYADGDFTGAPYESDFGPLQIEAVIKGGVIVSLNLLQVPDHRERSAEISAEVIPVLIQEAIQAQSPRIDIVASATYTTAAFADALYNTLSKAQKN